MSTILNAGHGGQIIPLEYAALVQEIERLRAWLVFIKENNAVSSAGSWTAATKALNGEKAPE